MSDLLCLNIRPCTSSLYLLLTRARSDNCLRLECLRAVLQPRDDVAPFAVDARTPKTWSRIHSWISKGRIAKVVLNDGACSARWLSSLVEGGAWSSMSRQAGCMQLAGSCRGNGVLFGRIGGSISDTLGISSGSSTSRNEVAAGD